MRPAFKKTELDRLAQVVREETGNHVREKNYTMLEARLTGRMHKLGLSNFNEYWAYFEENEAAEREVLQSLMTTHYTFFFREPLHFDLVERWIAAEAARLKERYVQTKAPVRVWSAAASRGQEVYTLAMFLEVHLKQKHGVDYEILGTDIDSASILYAKNGVYPIKEVNTIPQMYLAGFWRRGTGAIKDFAAVHPVLKAKTKFEVVNLLSLAKWRAPSTFDLIFCRNVFIYFSEENVKKIALELQAHLNPQGLLISGVSEPLRFAGWPLESIGPSCYVKTGLAPEPKSKVSGARRESPPLVQLKKIEKIEYIEKKYSVLCVDDSPTIELLIKKIFQLDVNCTRVDVAGNGKEARERLDRFKYDLVTLDIHMPEVNGIEFLERLYKRSEDPPVIMVSSVSRTDIDLATRALALGAFDYVEKPVMNKLQKSADEILAKAKMAVRYAQKKGEAAVSTFDQSISQKIIVPDASMCLRILLSSAESFHLLMQAIAGQKSEHRSPPLLLVWEDPQELLNIESELLKITDKNLIILRDAKTYLKPNCIYIAPPAIAKSVTQHLKAKSVSIQILDKNHLDVLKALHAPQVQILIDESMAPEATQIESLIGKPISDMTPPTSFASLSVEFFAELRKAA